MDEDTDDESISSKGLIKSDSNNSLYSLNSSSNFANMSRCATEYKVLAKLGQGAFGQVVKVDFNYLLFIFR